MLQRVYRVHFALLLAEQVLLMPPHLFVLHLRDLLIGFLGLQVDAGLLALFAIVLQKLQKLNHVIVNRVSR
jgi:hypothetical protein